MSRAQKGGIIRAVSEDRIDSRLYVTVEAGPAATERLAAALGAAAIACVLIEAPRGGRLDVRSAQPLVKLAQDAGAAALLADDAELARVLKADGVHLAASPDPAAAYAHARSVLGNRFIVGADAGRSRDDAMTLAELGADYVAFSPEGEDGAQGRDALCEWWAEIFQVPCVALGVASTEAAASLQDAQCDFLGITLPSGEPPAASRDLIALMHAALHAAHAEAHS